MNGAHDMGGVMGFGPVIPEKDEPVFHGRWEERVMAMTIAMSYVGGWSLDQSRSARENVPPIEYLKRSYYEIWLAGLTRVCQERGLIAEDELKAGKSLASGSSARRAISAEEIPKFIASIRPFSRPVATPARFAVGDKVRAKNMHPTTHTRLPRYVRGHEGTVVIVHEGHVFADTSAYGNEAPQWLYTVRFAARTLWGDAADPTVSVSVDAFESYLEPVA